MAVITVDDVQAYLEETKAPYTALETGPVAYATAEIFGILERRYDTTAWITTTNTPALVRNAVAMLTAGLYIKKLYGEDNADDNAYADMLQKQAYTAAHSLVEGTMVMP